MAGHYYSSSRPAKIIHFQHFLAGGNRKDIKMFRTAVSQCNIGDLASFLLIGPGLGRVSPPFGLFRFHGVR